MRATKKTACRVRVQGIVQGVGFRPFIYRLAREHGIVGWVLNDEAGVDIHIEGADEKIDAFLSELPDQIPPLARIDAIDRRPCDPEDFEEFAIVESRSGNKITTRISPDMVVCAACLEDLNDPASPYYRYPYVNCTHCGPRYSIIKSLPYDRPATTMAAWPMCEHCRAAYENPEERRFHAQPVACSRCGPGFRCSDGEDTASGLEAIERACDLLNQGKILAVKGIGGYHLALDAGNDTALELLRRRKYRKEKPFAIMAKSLEHARLIVDLDRDSENVLLSAARPIVLAASRANESFNQDLLAPDNGDLGVMLPYTPLHHLLFDCGAPEYLVLTSANRSNEPISYEDEDALATLEGIADAFLVGERPIQRRVDDSVVATSSLGLHMIRRARGYAPGAVTTLPTDKPVLALGADLKNTITLVVAGQAFVSQYIGDLEQTSCYDAFRQTVQDLTSMYGISYSDLIVCHDRHPQYRSSQFARELPCMHRIEIQHHRAHVASVLAEHGLFDKKVLGIAFDGTGWGDDEAIWGGEFFAGSLNSGFDRVASLRYLSMPGGDAAARSPAQAAAGFIRELPEEVAGKLLVPPFDFSETRFETAMKMLDKDFQCRQTTSAGRLFDAAAALTGFHQEVSFEAQAAIWLEHRARASRTSRAYSFEYDAVDRTLDWRDALTELIADRIAGKPREEIARAFHLGLARGMANAAKTLCEEQGLSAVAISGGVMQNMLLLDLFASELRVLKPELELLCNSMVPANDGGISLGQAAMACFLE
ncbi:MAG: carbamoyltransferase HypF [Cyanobacteria bacterium HKST-UBA02]|nr:carbamoyltransferase HypF [Cyanobacteria bacterium HKST-UBA02]